MNSDWDNDPLKIFNRPRLPLVPWQEAYAVVLQF